ncbi:MAG TPA: arsenate reductase (glutaredoxin) [Bacteroidales bacterium]|nr:arsenate reductase (glutaredoxin) [Bacteroidales bacterium]
MLKIYHNTRCKKSRAALLFLEQKGIDFQVIDYIKSSITKDDVQVILLKMNAKAEELLRTQEPEFKKHCKGLSFTQPEWIRLICENPQMLKRPIVVGKYKAVIADPPEKILEVL